MLSTRNDMRKCKGRTSNPTYKKLAKMKYNLLLKPVWNLGISKFFGISHLYYYLTENEDNFTTISFEEGAPDIAQNGAQVPILDEAEAAQIHRPI